MAASIDPATGRPRYTEGQASRIGSDLDEVSKWATDMGNRTPLTTEQRLAYKYVYPGLECYDTTLKAEFTHDGTGWELTPKIRVDYAPTMLVGTVPPQSAKLRRIEGIFTLPQTNAAGDAGLTYPKAFTGGVVSAQVSRYDHTVYGASPLVVHATQTTSVLNVRLFNSSGQPLASASGVRVTISVLGWDR
ncbi:hypothetical protein [Mycetocola saprophilus]|uniref:hypothetical protein n=1 Tax=Mycetocola saprophilus TaxID=76636 RepID=UPI003BF3BFF1